MASDRGTRRAGLSHLLPAIQRPSISGAGSPRSLSNSRSPATASLRNSRTNAWVTRSDPRVFSSRSWYERMGVKRFNHHKIDRAAAGANSRRRSARAGARTSSIPPPLLPLAPIDFRTRGDCCPDFTRRGRFPHVKAASYKFQIPSGTLNLYASRIQARPYPMRSGVTPG